MHEVEFGEALLSDRVKAIESSGIRRVFDLGAKLVNPVNLSIGQPDFSVPEVVREAAKRAIDEGQNRYTPTQGILPLRQKVSDKLRQRNEITVDPEDVLITSGSSGGIFLVLATILNPGDEVIIPDPYFVMYPQLVKFLGATPVLVDTYPDFQVDPDRVARAITPRTKAIVLNTPNNPTGAVYPEETLRAIANLAAERGTLVISDEVYEDFVYDGEPHFSIGSIYPHTVTLNAFSKSHALTGWRVGYAVGPQPILNKMRELQQYTFVCAPSFAQVAAIAALDVDMTAEIDSLRQRRDLVYDGLRAHFDVVKPAGAFYVMPKVSNEDAGEFVERAIGRNVLVIPGSVFSDRGTHIRISYATTPSQIQQGVDVLADLARSGQS